MIAPEFEGQEWTVREALMLDCASETCAALLAFAPDALLADVWDQLPTAAQEDLNAEWA